MSEKHPVAEKSWRQFFANGGYDAIDKAANQTIAAKKLGLSRKTLSWILEKPRRLEASKDVTQRKYYENLEDTEGWKEYEKRFKVKYKGATAEDRWKRQKKIIAKAFSKLGGKTGPEDWTKEDYDIIWEMYKHPKLGQITQQQASPFHNLMKATGKSSLLPLFPSAAHARGKKKEYYLDETDIKNILEAVPRLQEKNDIVVMSMVGIVKGARISSLLKDTPLHYNWKLGTSTDYEQKVSLQIKRYIPKTVLDLVKHYIEDCQIGENDLIFPDTYESYLDRLRKVGKAAGIKKYKVEEGQYIELKGIGTHIFKHTYVTQASRHGIPAEVIGKQVGTELRTLEAHYIASDEAKMKHFMQGEELGKEREQTFIEWIDSLMPLANKVYEQNCANDDRCRRQKA